MSLKYSPQEVLKIAIQVEDHGKDFYSEMAQKSIDPKVKGLLSTLAAQEIAHASFFQSLLEKEGFFSYDPSVENEYDSYFDAIANEFVFTPDLLSKRKSIGFASDIDVLDFAIGMEKNAVLTYSAMKSYVCETEHCLLEKIVAEEQAHYTLLSALKVELTTG